MSMLSERLETNMDGAAGLVINLRIDGVDPTLVDPIELAETLLDPDAEPDYEILSAEWVTG